MTPPPGRPPSGSAGSGGDPFRIALWCSVGFVVVGGGLLAAGSGADPVGWLALLFGLIGVVVCGGARLGWITPPSARARTRPADRERSQAGPSEVALPDVELSGAGRNRMADIVAALRAAGVFAPYAPNPAHLHEAVADHGEPVTVDAVLAALHEADHYHPDFRPEACRANLVFHASHTEQHEDALRQQIADLVTLSAGALPVLVHDIRLTFAADGAADRALIRMTVDGDELVLDYAAHPKYLSTVIHVSLARALRATGAPRLAWLWSDQGVWITALPDRDLERLNSSLWAADAGPDPAADRWEWVDEQPPVAAGR